MEKRSRSYPFIIKMTQEAEMNTPALTHNFPFHILDENMRTFMMGEFVAQGEPNLVLTGKILRQMMQAPGYKNSYRESLAKSGARFVGAHLPFSALEDLNTPSGSEREQMLMRQKLALRIVSEFDVEVAVAHAGPYPQSRREFSVAELTGQIVKSVEELLPEAEAAGVRLAIENCCSVTNTADVLVEVMSHFDSHWVGLCYDSGHANLMTRDRGVAGSYVERIWEGCGPVRYDTRILEKMLPHIIICHLHDNNGLDDQHLLPGQGEVDWPATMGALRRAPRLGYIQNEARMAEHGESLSASLRIVRENMKLL